MIMPMAAPCGVKTFYGWMTDHYETQPSKILGIWTCDPVTSRLHELRTKWGYSHLLYSGGISDYNWNQVVSAGYTLDKVMIAVTDVPEAQRFNFISNFGNAYAYYVGEPADQGKSINYVRYSINSLGYSSLFVVDGYKRNASFDWCVNQADIALYSVYNDWYYFGGLFWVEGLNDQRPSWDDMSAKYGSKFSMSWICTSEITEFGSLFGHAQNLGLSGIWIYAFYDNNMNPVAYWNDKYEEISNSAWQHGFLRKFEQSCAIEWRCDGGCECDPDDPDAGWYVYRIVPLGTIREVIP